MAQLILYENACKAIQTARAVDEVKGILDKTEAVRAYARQAKNKNLEVDAAEIRMRAERRLGQMLQHQRITHQMHLGGRPSENPTNPNRFKLQDVGIDKTLSSRAQKMASIPEPEFEEILSEWRERVAEENHRVTINLFRAAKKAKSRSEREAELAQKIVNLPDAKFGVILADPPWRFEVRSDKGLDRSASNHYPTMTIDDICSLDVPSISADDCVLFLWGTTPMLQEALRAMEEWGFEYKTHFIWNKNKIGTGYWSRSKHEILLVGTRGSIPAPEPGTQWASVIDAPVGEHSAKPDVFFELIEKLFPNLPKLEMNCRGSARDGWAGWGLEAE